MSSQSSGSDAFTVAATTLVIVGLLAAGAFVIKLVVALATELFRIYKARAFQPTTTARILWGALALLIGLWCLAAVLATNILTMPAAAYIATWSFLGFVVCAEGCD